MIRLAGALVLTIGILAAPPASAATTATGTVRLDGVRVVLRSATTQVVTVNRTHGWHARATLWVRTASGWRRGLRTTDARVGYGGLSVATRRHQGDGTTPLGTFDLMSTFGTHARRSAWSMPYRRTRAGDYWVGDNSSRYYNQLRTRAQGGFRLLPASDPEASEHLAHYRRQYEYAFVTSFNVEQVRWRGFAIFLHVNGRGATAGCVSLPRSMMRKLFHRLEPSAHPVIAIGR
ncbi:L,D-transpeptidase family protein [Nocardioides sp. Kera G14]|uniref:L,D-transpeptidase family protein n=1 Tax=Nocardioides sp. Kera G14 TaxID=2884264 RepID=UPI001D100F57|nr:L,D-transpeptidase family protein [Nocardioides sp. Kera G14]UDY24901.1 L,D-transpeptidase family protein [Nocardioides sp. Kera G14]